MSITDERCCRTQLLPASFFVVGAPKSSPETKNEPRQLIPIRHLAFLILKYNVPVDGIRIIRENKNKLRGHQGPPPGVIFFLAICKCSRLKFLGHRHLVMHRVSAGFKMKVAQ